MSSSSQEQSLEWHAEIFVYRAHASIGQLRKYSQDSYIVHPRAVAALVRSVPHTDAMLCAAWLHDVVEDTPVSLDIIEHEFGPTIASLVEMVTDVSRPSDGNRATRKAIDRQHIAKASPQAKTIKLADIIDNSKDILSKDPKFAKVYIPEKIRLLEVLEEGDPALYQLAWEIVNNYAGT